MGVEVDMEEGGKCLQGKTGSVNIGGKECVDTSENGGKRERIR